MSEPWLWMLGGIVLFVEGIRMLATGDGGTYRGISIPLWVAWVFIICGGITTVFYILALRRGEGTSPKYTDEDAKHAEDELDKIYKREHGEAPPKPKGRFIE